MHLFISQEKTPIWRIQKITLTIHRDSNVISYFFVA